MLVFATDNGKIDDGRNLASYEQREIHDEQYDIPNTRRMMLVGLYPPNPLGFYDMVANGEKWVLDWYSAIYPRPAEHNPAGVKSGFEKVMRGRVNKGGQPCLYFDDIQPTKTIPYSSC